MTDNDRELKYIEIKVVAIEMVNAFDQANPNHVLDDFLKNIGSQGQILKNRVEKLRGVLNKYEQLTILSTEQVKKQTVG
jgi:hypothetical protein